MFPSLKQFIRSFSHEDFTKNPNPSSLSVADQRALFVGLINSEQITAYTDSLTTGLPKDRVLQGLSEAWEIFDPKGAYEIIEWLQKEGHREFYASLLPFLKISDVNNRNELLEQQFGEDAEKAIGFVDNLIECIDGRGNDTFVPFNEQNMQKGILAWDLGRLVVLARLAFDAGYIDESTAWGVIRNAYQMAIKEFSDWKEIAISYLIGRGMAGGDSRMLDGLYTIAAGALEDDNSPWNKVSLE